MTTIKFKFPSPPVIQNERDLKTKSHKTAKTNIHGALALCVCIYRTWIFCFTTLACHVGPSQILLEVT